jgi:hypothetical protein
MEEYWFMRGVLLVFFFWFSAIAGLSPATAQEFFKEDFEHGIGPQWKKVEFTSETHHTIRKEGTNSFLEARAESSASGLGVKLDSISTAGTVLRWRWKIDRVPEDGSDSDIKKFDHTARIFVAFKTLIGPPRSINYVWANEAGVGKTFEHPSSGRSRFVVLESGNAKAGRWITEERDVAADWKLLFRENKVPAIVGLGIMTDSDGTRTTVTGSYDDLELRAKK